MSSHRGKALGVEDQILMVRSWGFDSCRCVSFPRLFVWQGQTMQDADVVLVQYIILGYTLGL